MRNQVKKKYYFLQLQEIQKIEQLDSKPSLLMHTCCGVCASYPSLYLAKYFDLTLFYNNDNIYPIEEYQRRYDELIKLIEKYNSEFGTNIKVIKTDFDKDYINNLAPYKDEPERGKRCQLCYRLRMKKALQYASDNNFDYFTTVMSISRQKDSNVLNQIGEDLIKDYPNIKYFYSDFKKDNGQDKTNKLANKYNLYRQQYCGCIYSYQDYLKRAKEKSE